MPNVIQFPAPAVPEAPRRASTAHETPIMRFYFRRPGGEIEQGTISTTMPMGSMHVSDEQKQDYCRHIARSVKAIGCELLEIYSMRSTTMSISASAHLSSARDGDSDQARKHTGTGS